MPETSFIEQILIVLKEIRDLAAPNQPNRRAEVEALVKDLISELA